MTSHKETKPKKKNYMRNYRSVVANVLASDIVVYEFKLQTRYYFHFQKIMDALILPQMG